MLTKGDEIAIQIANGEHGRIIPEPGHLEAQWYPL